MRTAFPVPAYGARRTAVALLAAAACSACSAVQPVADPSSAAASGRQGYSSLPAAPTWSVERRKLADDRYVFDLRQKYFAIGGDGEAQQVFQRAAEALAAEAGAAGYTVLSYTEGIESGPLIGQRVSRGLVRLDGIASAAR